MSRSELFMNLNMFPSSEDSSWGNSWKGSTYALDTTQNTTLGELFI
jgi:hypothetical protein